MNKTSNDLSLNSMNALILAGGKSSRMGTDKALLPWKGILMYQHIANLISPFCKHIYISSNLKNKKSFSDFPIILDSSPLGDIGPINGLISAFHKHTGPWLVMGCDYPLINQNDIQELLDKRNIKKIATIFKNTLTDFIEPCIGIYEDTSKLPLQKWVQSGNHSLRIFLENNDVEFILPQNPDHLQSMDTPEIYKKLKMDA